MTIQVELLEKDCVQRFKIVGEIDAFTAPVLREHLGAVEQVEGMQVEVDLAEVDYMDSTGLGVFVGFYKAVHAKNGHLKITGVNARLQRLFEITGLGAIMDIETEESGDADATV